MERHPEGKMAEAARAVERLSVLVGLPAPSIDQQLSRRINWESPPWANSCASSSVMPLSPIVQWASTAIVSGGDWKEIRGRALLPYLSPTTTTINTPPRESSPAEHVGWGGDDGCSAGDGVGMTLDPTLRNSLACEERRSDTRRRPDSPKSPFGEMGLLRIGGWEQTQARPANSRVSVATLTLSPSLMKSGTRISTPVSSLAGLVTLPPDESPRGPGSV